MARPKQFKSLARVNLIMEAKRKKAAAKLAFERNKSMGRLFEDLVAAEYARMQLAAANGPEAAQ